MKDDSLYPSNEYINREIMSPGLIEASFNEAIYNIAEEIADLVCQKQWDYGTENILGSPGGPGTGILVRLWDKISRLKNLTKKRSEGLGNYFESIQDTYVDIAGYALLAIMVERGKFTLPLKDPNPLKEGLDVSTANIN